MLSKEDLIKLTNDALASRLKPENPLSDKELEDWYIAEFCQKASNAAGRGYNCIDLFFATRHSPKVYDNINQIVSYLKDKGFIVHGYFVYW